MKVENLARSMNKTVAKILKTEGDGGNGKDPDLIYTQPGGGRVCDFDPPDDDPDASDVNAGYEVKWQQRGMWRTAAERRARIKPVRCALIAEYFEYVPCIRCRNCVIIRERRHGIVVNRAYACSYCRIMVSRYGTCKWAIQGKSGPVVIERDTALEEVEREKMNLVN